jgi:hypothetical protein
MKFSKLALLVLVLLLAAGLADARPADDMFAEPVEIESRDEAIRGPVRHEEDGTNVIVGIIAVIDENGIPVTSEVMVTNENAMAWHEQENDAADAMFNGGMVIITTFGQPLMMTLCHTELTDFGEGGCSVGEIILPANSTCSFDPNAVMVNIKIKLWNETAAWYDINANAWDWEPNFGVANYPVDIIGCRIWAATEG